MKFSPQQDAALKDVDRWFYQESRKKKIYRCFGFAGSGKTTLAKHFAEHIDGDVCYAAFTGKAALTMQKNGCYGARTIHSTIYIPETRKDGTVNFRLNYDNSPLSTAKLMIVDECSMVDEALARDLLSFGKPILVLGDPAQLPPPSGAGYFTEKEPDTMLTEIHRQSKENPIIALATHVREGNQLELGTYGESRVIDKLSKADILETDQVLVGRNITRETVNTKIRRLKGFDSDYPQVGEKLICLKNDSTLGIFNGGMFTVTEVMEPKIKSNFLHMRVISDDGLDDLGRIVRVHKSAFSDEVPVPSWKLLQGAQDFYYGYAITTHKAQGSQWENCTIYDESYCFRDDWNRWLYTSITRASNKITVYKT